MNLDKLIKAWNLSSDLHRFENPASERDLQGAEEILDISIPSVLRELYQFSNGIYLLEGNLSIYPLFGTGNNLGLINASRRLREWKWPIPDEVLVIGNNGSDEQIGIWYQETKSQMFTCPVLEIGEIFEDKNMAVLATDIIPFLTGWSLYYLMLLEADPLALDVLGVPDSLRIDADDLDNQLFAEIRRWADPKLPDLYPDPYARGYDADGLRNLFSVQSGLGPIDH